MMRDKGTENGNGRRWRLNTEFNLGHIVLLAGLMVNLGFVLARVNTIEATLLEARKELAAYTDKNNTQHMAIIENAARTAAILDTYYKLNPVP